MTLTVSEARRRLFPLVKEVNDDAKAVEIIDKSGVSAFLVPAQEYNSIRETAYLLRSPANAAALRESIAELNAGKVEVHELIEPNSLPDAVTASA